MYRNNNDTFVLVKDSTGERLIRRYSGNINIKPS
jgi:ribosomal protein S11